MPTNKDLIVTHVALDKEMHEKLMKLLRDEARTYAGLVRILLRDYLEKRGIV